ncbi:hypothetical protein GCM10009569_35210 [Arthrobacter russicus]
MAGVEEFFVHSVKVETFQGTGAYGDAYAPPVTHSPATGTGVFLESKRRLVRDKSGQEVISETTLYLRPAQAGLYEPDSRVEARGVKSYVISRAVLDAPGLGLPDHAVITLK